MSSNYSDIVIVIAALVIWRRTRSMFRPIKGNGARLLLPLLYLVPCILFLMNPKFHLGASEWWAAAGIGFLLSIPLIWTTNYERRSDQHIYAVKSMGFIIAFLAVLAARLLLHNYWNSLEEESRVAIYLTTLLGCVLPWRIVSFLKFRKLHRSQLKFNT